MILELHLKSTSEIRLAPNEDLLLLIHVNEQKLHTSVILFENEQSLRTTSVSITSFEVALYIQY